MNTIIFMVVACVSLVAVLIFAFSRFKMVKNDGQALIIKGMRKTTATFTGGWVWPIINSSETMDITRRKISIKRIGKKESSSEEEKGIHCKDNIRANMKVDFYIGVNPDVEDVLKVSRSLTPKGVTDINVLKEHLEPKFSGALKAACKKFDFKDLFTSREEFKTEVERLIENDLEGFKIYDVIIDDIEQSSVDSHDPDNVLDSEGLLKITEITAKNKIEKHIYEEEELTKIKSKSVEQTKLRLALVKQEKEEEEKNAREISDIKSREKAEAEIVKSQEFARSEKARIEQELQTGIENENKEAEIEAAKVKNAEKLAIQNENKERTVRLQNVMTEKEVSKVEAEKRVIDAEGEREVAEIVSNVVQVERKTAKEKEETKDFIAQATAEREKLVKIKNSEAEIESKNVILVAEAEAAYIVSEKEAETIKRKADASLYENQKDAEGITLRAEAEKHALSSKGLAEVAVEEKKADAIEKVGAATANAKRMFLEATETGSAESREFDKWQKKEEYKHEENLRSIEATKESDIAKAKSIGEALSSADIKLFGGEGVQSISDTIMKSAKLDATVDSSKVLSNAMSRYEEGSGHNLMEDLKEVLQKSDVSTGDIGTLTLTQLFAKNPNILSDFIKKVQG